MLRSQAVAFLVASLSLAGGALAENKPGTKAPAKAAAPDAVKPAPAPAIKPAPTAPPSVPRPPAQLDVLAFLTGTFNCQGTMPAVPATTQAGAAEQAPASYKARFASKWALDKFFLGFQYAQVKAKDHPVAFVAEGHLGYDAGLKRFVFLGADNVGGSFLLRADEVGEGPLVFKGESTGQNGRHVPIEFRYTRTPKGFDFSSAGADAEGQMIEGAKEVCTRGK